MVTYYQHTHAWAHKTIKLAIHINTSGILVYDTYICIYMHIRDNTMTYDFNIHT